MNRRKALKSTGLVAGASMMIPSFMTLLQSCGDESRLDWKPLFLNEEEALLVSALVDTILPKTDTPGALDVKVDMFIDKVFAKTYDKDSQAQIKSEILAFNTNCKNKFGKSFSDLNSEGRANALIDAESRAGTFNGSVWGTAVGTQQPVGFYRSIKSMALWAYTSSEEVGKNVLNYDPIPAGYNGCMPLSEVGNSWSL